MARTSNYALRLLTSLKAEAEKWQQRKGQRSISLLMLPWLKNWQLCGQHGTSRSGLPVPTWRYSISSWHARERNHRVQVMNYPMRKSPEVPRQPVISQGAG